jgi:hypothetical protein
MPLPASRWTCTGTCSRTSWTRWPTARGRRSEAVASLARTQHGPAVVPLGTPQVRESSGVSEGGLEPPTPLPGTRPSLGRGRLALSRSFPMGLRPSQRLRVRWRPHWRRLAVVAVPAGDRHD